MVLNWGDFFLEKLVRGWIHAVRCRRLLNCVPAEPPKSDSFWGKLKTKNRQGNCSANIVQKTWIRFSSMLRPVGMKSSTPYRLQHPIEPWICLLIVGSSTKRYAAAFGQEQDSIN